MSSSAPQYPGVADGNGRDGGADGNGRAGGDEGGASEQSQPSVVSSVVQLPPWSESILSQLLPRHESFQAADCKAPLPVHANWGISNVSGEGNRRVAGDCLEGSIRKR